MSEKIESSDNGTFPRVQMGSAFGGYGSRPFTPEEIRQRKLERSYNVHFSSMEEPEILEEVSKLRANLELFEDETSPYGLIGDIAITLFTADRSDYFHRQKVRVKTALTAAARRLDEIKSSEESE